ncbi:hypothetical protein C8J57DRAFT_1240407 [Mycena rebaudengoi]|nr:hypothetical protein C8J57DRAFT_1240407 [Mycena rebaudengoi]
MDVVNVTGSFSGKRDVGGVGLAEGQNFVLRPIIGGKVVSMYKVGGTRSQVEPSSEQPLVQRALVDLHSGQVDGTGKVPVDSKGLGTDAAKIGSSDEVGRRLLGANRGPVVGQRLDGTDNDAFPGGGFSISQYEHKVIGNQGERIFGVRNKDIKQGLEVGVYGWTRVAVTIGSTGDENKAADSVSKVNSSHFYKAFGILELIVRMKRNLVAYFFRGAFKCVANASTVACSMLQVWVQRSSSPQFWTNILPASLYAVLP